VIPGLGVDQLRRDANPNSGALDTAFEDRPGAQSLADVPYISWSVFVGQAKDELLETTWRSAIRARSVTA
jgi:hypothetical protein